MPRVWGLCRCADIKADQQGRAISPCALAGCPSNLLGQSAGEKYLFAATTPNIDAACLPNANPMLPCISPDFGHGQHLAFCSCDKPRPAGRAIAHPQITDVALTG
jgi:hypothetical protein